MKAAVLALLCLLFVVRAADNHTHAHPTGEHQAHPGSTPNHKPNSTHLPGHDTHCKHQELHANDKVKILAALNKLRSETAGGHVGHFPKASNMRQIRWDPLLEDEARHWASNCSAHNSPHNRAKTGSHHVVKELIFISTGCQAYSEPHWDKAFQHWASGNKTAQLSLITNYTYSAGRKDAERAFTLLNWAETHHVGCSFSNFETLSHTPIYKQFLVCHFSEGGNQLGHPVYLAGEPASNCGVNFTKSTEYPNLCTNHTVIPHNPFNHIIVTPQPNNITLNANCTGYEFTKAEKEGLLAALNKERSSIATGGYLTSKNVTIRPNGFPKAGNMRNLLWDDKLAAKARENVAWCKPTSAENKTKLDVSEILFAQSSLNSFAAEPNWKVASAYWISRKEGVKSTWIDSFDFSNATVADREASTYTQIIWADSWEIGCAYANLENVWSSKVSTAKLPLNTHIQYIICYFTNPGDVKGKPIYAQGEPCSKCSTDFHTCDAKTDGLCHKK